VHGYVTAGNTSQQTGTACTFANAAALPRGTDRSLQQLPLHVVNQLMQVQAVVDSSTEQLQAMAMFTDVVAFTTCKADSEALAKVKHYHKSGSL
jgi:hypothetical protein